jgi:Flagellar hook-length control protein FliK
LTTTLAALLPHEAPLPDAATLQEQVDKSGLNYEAKVADFLSKPAVPTDQAALTQDLKGQLLELLSKLDQLSTTHEDVSAIRQQVQQALQTIEFQQLANLFAHQEHQSLLLQFMHPSFATSHTAQLYCRVDPSDASTPPDESRGYTLVFLLDFTSLGPIRIDAVVRQAHITATISTAEAAVADFITTHTPLLRARLQALGWQAEVHCRAQEEVPLEVEDTFSRLLMAEPSRLLDVTT